MKPQGDRWASAAFIRAGDRGVVHDHESGVRVITSDDPTIGAMLSVTYVPARFRVAKPPHPIVGERATDDQVAMALRAFGAEAFAEDNSEIKGPARMFWASFWASTE